MVSYQTCVFVTNIVTGECTVLLLQKYVLKVFVVLFGFSSSSLKVFIHLRCIITQRQTTTPVHLWFRLSRVILLCWYYKNTVLWFVWYCLVFIQIIIKFIFIYPAWTPSNKQHHHLTSLTSYHLVTAECWDCMRGQPNFVREIWTQR